MVMFQEIIKIFIIKCENKYITDRNKTTMG